MTLTLTDHELKVVIKSLSMTYDALTNRIDRLRGQKQADARAEFAVVDRVLTRAKEQQTARIMGTTERTA
jgi:hypothetical protein